MEIIHVRMTVGMEEILIDKPLYLVLMKNDVGNIKECKTLISHEYVTVNDIVMTNSHYKPHYSDVIKVNGKVIKTNPFVYIMMNKPSGYICANTDKKYPCVIDLIPYKDCSCIGRLDKDTTGLLLLTNDKSLIKKMLLPENHIEKTYEVITKYPLNEILVSRFSNGILIDGNKKCLPALLSIKESYRCFVTLYEGKYHQIKKMFLSCQNEVVHLKRMSFSHIILDNTLKEGEFRFLTKNEFQKMKYSESHKNEVYNVDLGR